MMVFHSSVELAQYLDEIRSQGKSIGFVPTMGALHEGHLKLCIRAVKENDTVVASIYVNPTQFNNAEDLKNYPRLPEQDLNKLEAVGCHAVFMPTDEDMYPEGKKLLDIDLEGLDQVMEGKFRPGHFQGMVTVVHALFEKVKPHRAYFGEKDFQQLAIIRFMVKNLQLPIEVHGCPTTREANGLAMSSRNMRLSENERNAAADIFKALYFMRENSDKLPTEKLIEEGKRILTQSGKLECEYLELADELSLKPIVSGMAPRGARAFVAAYCGPVRLIDNLPLFS
jgi:pantoate--beta-alanine ligase